MNQYQIIAAICLLALLLTAQDGCLWVDGKPVESHTVRDGACVGWMSNQPGDANTKPWDGDVTYLDIVIQQEQHLAGYAVAEIRRDADNPYYRAKAFTGSNRSAR